MTPGMICLSRKARNATFRNYVAAERPPHWLRGGAQGARCQELYFAGICRSKTVWPIDDDRPRRRVFTLHIGGMVVRKLGQLNRLTFLKKPDSMPRNVFTDDA